MASVFSIPNCLKQIVANAFHIPDEINEEDVHLVITIPNSVIKNEQNCKVSAIIQTEPMISCIIKFDVVDSNFLFGSIQFLGEPSSLLYTVILYHINSQNKIQYSEKINVSHLTVDPINYFTQKYQVSGVASLYTSPFCMSVATQTIEFIKENVFMYCKIAINTIETPDIPKIETSVFACLYDNKLISDFKIVCGDREFFAYQAILACRSPVFQAMLESPLKESQEHKLNISDFEPITVELMLRYIYSNEIKADLSKEELQKLFMIAHKYELKDLKKATLKALYRYVNSIDDIVDITFFAGSYNFTEFKKYMIELIKMFRHVQN